MSRYEVNYNGNRTVDLTLYGVTVLKVYTTDPERSDDYVTLGMSQAAFEWLSGERVRAELKKSLDDALSQIQRLSDERDEWKERAERGEATLARYPQPLWDPDVLRRNLFVISDGDAATVDELKAVIVSQAREIARLKGEIE